MQLWGQRSAGISPSLNSLNAHWSAWAVHSESSLMPAKHKRKEATFLLVSAHSPISKEIQNTWYNLERPEEQVRQENCITLTMLTGRLKWISGFWWIWIKWRHGEHTKKLVLEKYLRIQMKQGKTHKTRAAAWAEADPWKCFCAGVWFFSLLPFTWKVNYVVLHTGYDNVKTIL